MQVIEYVTAMPCTTSKNVFDKRFLDVINYGFQLMYTSTWRIHMGVTFKDSYANYFSVGF